MTVISIQITDGDWDAHETDASTSFSSTGVTLRCEASTTSTSRYNAGLYFPNVTLPADATVDVAYISVVFPAGQRDSPDLHWYGNLVADAGDFVTDADVTTRLNSAATTANVAWSDTNLGSGTPVNSPSLVSIVQEIQALGSWASGNAMAFIAAGDNTTAQESGCRFTPYETAPADTCILHIEYTAAAEPPAAAPTVVGSTFYLPDISINVSEPIWSSSKFNSSFSSRIASYSHQRGAAGGDISATIGLNIRDDETEEWLENGLGRDIIVYNFDTLQVWRGFVNQIDAAIGSLSISRGPLLNVANKVVVKFDGMYTNPAEDTDSQAKYGIRYKVIQSNTKSLTIANNHRDTFLEENSLPTTTPPSLGQANASSMTINCLGYYSMLAFPYLFLVDSSTTAREKIIDVLEQEPNAIFSTNYLKIETNTLSVFTLEKDFPQGTEVIKAIIDAGGDSNNNRRIFGVEGDRQFFVYEIPNSVKYSTRIRSQTNELKEGETTVQPIDIKPGQWVRIDDFLLGIGSDTLREDPRMVFIETVDYTYPFGYSITGGKTDTLPQKLAKLGLGSI